MENMHIDVKVYRVQTNTYREESRGVEQSIEPIGTNMEKII